MQIPIVQPSEEARGDLEFIQPRFHFGQVLEDAQSRVGFVFGMDFDGEWHYQLFYIQTSSNSSRIPENRLAIWAATLDVQTVCPMLNS